MYNWVILSHPHNYIDHRSGNVYAYNIQVPQALANILVDQLHIRMWNWRKEQPTPPRNARLSIVQYVITNKALQGWLNQMILDAHNRMEWYTQREWKKKIQSQVQSTILYQKTVNKKAYLSATQGCSFIKTLDQIFAGIFVPFVWSTDRKRMAYWMAKLIIRKIWCPTRGIKLTQKNAYFQLWLTLTLWAFNTINQSYWNTILWLLEASQFTNKKLSGWISTLDR